MNRNIHIQIISVALVLAFLSSVPSAATAATTHIHTKLLQRISSSDAVVLAAPDGKLIFKKNADKYLIPASILKVFTALVALHTLGNDYRFKTEFYLDRQLNLIIKGYGDPLLVSEVVADISARLASVLSNESALHGLILDESYFVQPLTIPGVSASSQPYDAPNGALCVNFNTVFFKLNKGKYVSAEPQTPLLPFALKRIKSNRGSGGRVVLSQIENENTLYAGELFKFFLLKENIRFSGPLSIGTAGPSATRILEYQSPYQLIDIVAKILEHSNNFVTNQLLIAAGIKANGAPGSLGKAVQTARKYATENLKVEGLRISEGSGISRKNRVTANQMLTVLQKFDPHYHLMRREQNEFYKTGTLSGISTRAGYLLDSDGQRFPFVVMCNSSGKTANSFLPLLKKLVE